MTRLNSNNVGKLKFIPASILDKIISDYLDYKDCAPLSKVNKAYNKLADQNPIFTVFSFMKAAPKKKWEERFSRALCCFNDDASMKVVQRAFFYQQKPFHFFSEKNVKSLIESRGNALNNPVLRFHQLVAKNLFIENKYLLLERPELLQLTSEEFRKDPNNHATLLNYACRAKGLGERKPIPDLCAQLIPKELKSEIFQKLDRLRNLVNTPGDVSQNVVDLFPEIITDKQVLIWLAQLISFSDDLVAQLDSSLKNDEEVWDALTSSNGRVTLKEAPPSIRANRRIVLRILNSYVFFIYDKKIMKNVIEKIDPSLLQFSDILSELVRLVGVEKTYSLIDKKLIENPEYPAKLVKIHPKFSELLPSAVLLE